MKKGATTTATVGDEVQMEPLSVENGPLSPRIQQVVDVIAEARARRIGMAATPAEVEP